MHANEMIDVRQNSGYMSRLFCTEARVKGSLRSSRSLSFSRRRGDRASRLTSSPYRLFFALSRSFPPVRERLEKERKRLLRRLRKGFQSVSKFQDMLQIL